MRFTSTSLKVLAVAVTALFVAACETESPDAGGAAGAGQAGRTATTAPTPAGPTPGTQAHLVATIGDRVFFDYDKYEIKPQARATVEKWAAYVKQFPAISVTIEGHCDERGTREYNLALGERRANAVKNALVQQGIPASRVATISYGKERPAALGSNEAAWSQNRRGVMQIN
jgi:peptidoglycan-associated lipoprotein